MRRLLLTLPLLLGLAPAAQAQVSVGIGVQFPGVSIGINLPVFPDLRPVPGYPVYYAPEAPGNYFFYDGLYWVFEGDEWYASGWYNGPWRRIAPYDVPLFVLRVPVRYYRVPPPYFRPWRADAPPRWGERWGREWEDRHRGWDRWDRRAVPPPAPLPAYQRKYPQSRYPVEPEQQRVIRRDEYRYQPRDPVIRQRDPWAERSPERPDADDRRQPQRDAAPDRGRTPERSEPPNRRPERADEGRGRPHDDQRKGNDKNDKGRGERDDNRRGGG